ncbi:MAG: general secretion pathway protein GspD [Leptotrichiaceae bacterium]|nr:general secretion pathway protein GspD [Leptotrichiaceae bacterium]MBP7101199.1 general secretion pathway protein GspD [Leptotrichiaceae bacterium]MBP7725170.1 general secretion pathway protein GspD [Leptotrichiaceae bacterium]MBP9629147.1 general secretion pathway protein GspD [Leptotrichiaceae bacterium]
MKKKFLFFILMLVILNTTFSEKITNYVNKKDVETGNKIFLFKAEPNNKSNNKDNQNKNESNVNNNLKDSDKDYNKVNNLVEINRNSTKNIVQIPENKVSEIDLEYIEAKEIAEKLDGFNGYKLVGIDNKIIINGNGKEMENLKRIIKSLDKPKEQIVIKGTIIDTSSNLFERIGVDWTINDQGGVPNRPNLITKFLNGEVSIAGIFAKGGHFLGIDFNLLKENGDIKIESMPVLLVMEKEEGEMKVTEEVLIGEKKTTKNNEEYIEPIFSEAGIVFKILPEIRGTNNEKKIILKIDTEISNFKLTSNYSESSGAKQKNQTKTIVSLNDGGSTFIGGLKQNVEKDTLRKVPFLSSIPVIGPLFKYKRANKEVRDIYVEIEAIIQK